MEFELSDENAVKLSECYFLLSEYYKAQRMHENSRTQDPKIAAITAVAIATTNPLRPKNSPIDVDLLLEYINPIFAIRVGCSMVNHPYERRHWGELHRWCEVLRRCAFPSILSYLHGEAELGKTEVAFSINREEYRFLESQISFYYTLGDQPIYKL